MMKPFYVRHKTREEAMEVIDHAVAHGATSHDVVYGHGTEESIFVHTPESYDYVGVTEKNNICFYSIAMTYGEDAQELTLQQVRELYPLPGEVKLETTLNDVLRAMIDDYGNLPPGSFVDFTPDPGQHYRFTYKGIKLDPFRIAQVYGITDFGQQTILKKVLRMGTAHKDREQDLRDIICAAERMLEMINEDKP